MEGPKKTLSGTSRREFQIRRCLPFPCRETRRNPLSFFFAEARRLKSRLPVTLQQANSSSLVRLAAVAVIWWRQGRASGSRPERHPE